MANGEQSEPDRRFGGQDGNVDRNEIEYIVQENIHERLSNL